MHYSPLRYPGGKSKITDFFSLLLDENYLYDCDYIEPYAGGAGVAINLLLNERVRSIYINDISFPVYCFWWSILQQTEELCERVLNVKITMDKWHECKKILENETDDRLAIGFAFFYLNRTSRSGIITGGPIGGFKQNGNYLIDARFNKLKLIDRISLIAELKNRIFIYNEDALNFLDKVKNKISERSIIYLDPPYYHNSKRLYLNTYTHEDHEEVAKYVQYNIKKPWVMTYDYCDEIRKLYKNRRTINLAIRYSASRFCVGKELAIFDDRVKINGLKEAFGLTEI